MITLIWTKSIHNCKQLFRRTITFDNLWWEHFDHFEIDLKDVNFLVATSQLIWEKLSILTSTSFVTSWFHLWKLNMDLGFSNPHLHFLRPWHEVPRHTIRTVLLLYQFVYCWCLYAFRNSIAGILQIDPKTKVREMILNQIKKHTVVASEFYHAEWIMHFISKLRQSNCILKNSHGWLIWWGSHFVTVGVAI